ncbi:MAG: hypothetical protein KAI24_08255 [Planctomycetes bacterium]|nr:hypothetical protein [Planctomycetota bacterium]
MSEEHDEPTGADAARPGGASRLRVVQGPVPSATEREQRPPVRLRREFKGLTVADLHREELARRLPGQVRSALHHIEQGDLRAAEQAVPGRFAEILEGPGCRRRGRWGWFVGLGLAAVATAAALVRWLLC